ncbi:MAG: hypothetical protein NW201_09725 [Gemmatimonadales bacterium]|nr:hypothetical protein [Gemmatimonadales bacterium]
MRRPLAIGLLAVHLAGCFRAVPLETASVPGGSRVVLTLSPAGTAAMRGTLGEGAVTIEATMMRESGDSLDLLLHRVIRTNGTAELYRGESYTVSRQGIAQLQLRKPDVARSALLGVIIAGGAIGVGRAIGLTGSNSLNPGGDPGPGPIN